MSELQKTLAKLSLRLERMGIRVAEAIDHSLEALVAGDVAAGEAIDQDDSTVDMEEVEIERECIDCLALYQPTAVDLRRICCIIKVNNDLERIADIAARLGRRVKHVVASEIVLSNYPNYAPLASTTSQILRLTLQSLNSKDLDLPRRIIALDQRIDAAYAEFAREALDDARTSTDVDSALTLVLLGRSLERVGDHCTNIAEDVLFLLTGEIVRHSILLRNGDDASRSDLARS